MEIILFRLVRPWQRSTSQYEPLSHLPFQKSTNPVLKGSDIYLSNRGDKSFPSTIPNTNASDSLATFSLLSNNEFQFRQLSTAGGAFPRQFSINKAGDLVAVGLQNSFKVVIITRNVETGILGDVVAEVDDLGQVTCVVWDERGR